MGSSSSSYTAITLGKYLAAPPRAGWITRSHLFPLWARWRRHIQGSRHTMKFTRSFLSINVFVFWQHVQCPSCLVVLRPSISVTPRSTGEEPPDIQRLTGFHQTSTLPFLKLLKLKELLTYSIVPVKLPHAHYINKSGPLQYYLKIFSFFFQSQRNMKIQSETTGGKAVLL